MFWLRNKKINFLVRTPSCLMQSLSFVFWKISSFWYQHLLDLQNAVNQRKTIVHSLVGICTLLHENWHGLTKDMNDFPFPCCPNSVDPIILNMGLSIWLRAAHTCYHKMYISNSLYLMIHVFTTGINILIWISISIQIYPNLKTVWIQIKEGASSKASWPGSTQFSSFKWAAMRENLSSGFLT